MRISVSDYSFSNYRRATGAGYEQICAKAKEIGFEGIEFTDLSGPNPEKTAESVRVYCEKIGLPIVSYTVGANFLSDSLSEEIEKVEKRVDVAAILGVSVMRHDAAFSLKDKAGYTWEDGIKDMADAIREVTCYAAEKGIRTCTENHGFIYQDSERVEALIREVNHPNYGWLVDIGNFLCAGEDSVKAVKRAAPYAFHVHAKDFLFKAKNSVDPAPEGFFRNRDGDFLRGTILGHGVIEIKSCVKLLEKAGYNGWYSLEFEGLEDNLTALSMGMNYLRVIRESLN
ncbi:MAG: sugar phosphate isomerase/epimerase [Clostridia bacterium]|nr:sugar phosphate isomerase/epimerase [Clostridia bacterium]